MKSRILTRITAISLFAVLAMPVDLVARDNQDHKTVKHHHYKLVDMWTFGGPASWVAPQFFASPVLNMGGVTVGGSSTSTPTTKTSNLLVCGGLQGLILCVDHAFQWKDRKVTDLRSLPGQGNCSNPFSVNDNAQVVGTSENGTVDPLTGINETRAVRWENGEIEDLGSFGGNQNGANGINDRAEIVGFSLNTTPDPYSLYDILLGSSNGTQTRAFLWQNGHMRDLGTLGKGAGPDASALFINQHGQIAGDSYTSSTPNPVTGLPPADPFLWEKGKMTDIGNFGGAFGLPTGLNNRGDVIGKMPIKTDPAACLVDNPNCHAFLWRHRSRKLIDLFPHSAQKPSFAGAINDAGEIVGETVFPKAQFFHAYIWRTGVATDLGTLHGDCYSTGQAINSHSQVVGNSVSCAGKFRAFLWEKGSIVDLNPLIPAGSPLELVNTMAINDRGEIAGVGAPSGCSDSNVCGHAFLLIPR
jgi:probable HAF family extracellular repeat protein